MTRGDLLAASLALLVGMYAAWRIRQNAIDAAVRVAEHRRATGQTA